MLITKHDDHATFEVEYDDLSTGALIFDLCNNIELDFYPYDLSGSCGFYIVYNANTDLLYNISAEDTISYWKDNKIILVGYEVSDEERKSEFFQYD